MTEKCEKLLDRIPPQNLEAEQSALGSMMIHGPALMVGCEMLAAGDFYRDAHQGIFKVLVSLKDKGEPVDMVTVQEEFRSRGDLEDVGGAEYLMALIDSVPTAANIEYYAGIVKEKAILRRLIDECTQIVSLAHGEVDDMDALLDSCERKIMAVSRDRQSADHGWHSYDEIGGQVYAIIEEAYHAGTAIRGLETGIGALDTMICGFMPGDLIILAGHPTTGKTALVQCISHHVARNGTAVAFFELEQTAEAMGFRAFQQEAGIDTRVLRNPKYMPDPGWTKLGEVLGEVQAMPIYLSTLQGLSASQVAARTRRAKQKWDVGLVIVDYLGMLALTPGENEVQALGRTCTAMKNIALELNVPLVLIHHLNRLSQNEKNRQPRLSDLRGSGLIEERADVVLFTHQLAAEKGETVAINLIVAKVKNFAEGKVKMVFKPQTLRFVEASSREPDDA